MLGSIGGTYAVYSLDNVLLWAPGIEIVDDEYSIAEGENMTYQRRVLATGTVWATSEGLTATYGTELNA